MGDAAGRLDPVIIEQLSLVDFRNYAAADVALQAGPNVFVGRNGQGKTNLAEAIAYFATLGSHRVSSDAPMVRRGADAAIVRARLAHGARHVVLEVQVNKQGSNKARVNGSAIRPAELPRYAQVVLFAPEDLQIVRGDPAARRRFMDQLLIQRTPRMAGVLGDYDRVVRQRNALLKSAKARGIRGEQLSTLEVWDDKLVALGAQVIDARADLAFELAEPLSRAYASIAGADHEPGLDWSLSIDGADPEEEETTADAAASGTTQDRFRTALDIRRTAELDRGLTLVGPHRDDLILQLRGLPVKGYASHGESWSMALGLRLASAELLRAESLLGDPLVILDDVFAELDADRRERLAGLVADYEQVIVTAAVEPDIPDALRAHVVRVEAGRITEADGGPITEPDGGPITERAAEPDRESRSVAEPTAGPRHPAESHADVD